MTPAERNRAEFPEIAAVIDQLRAQGGVVKVLWLAKQGMTIGPAPDNWADIFEVATAPEAAPAVAYRGTRRRP